MLLLFSKNMSAGLPPSKISSLPCASLMPRLQKQSDLLQTVLNQHQAQLSSRFPVVSAKKLDHAFYSRGGRRGIYWLGLETYKHDAHSQRISSGTSNTLSSKARLSSKSRKLGAAILKEQSMLEPPQLPG
eukprot:m.106514 g.106514  ORF g.106514 m.106514 type:complete len:130 (-) comp51677_c0_seq2:17-406(-)